ncbi:MAG: hypothetical protein WBN75_16355 [Verrucomicrobiia bacterium]|jgi:hypothetical protein
MKSLTPFTLVIVGMLAAGCAYHQPAPNAKPATPVAVVPQTIVTPDNSLTARVVSYNAAGRFVVLSFPPGQMPKQEQSLFLYRDGMKAGEVKITGPQRDNNTVADLVTGEAQVGDEVRDQ